MGSQRVRHDWATELNWTKKEKKKKNYEKYQHMGANQQASKQTTNHRRNQNMHRKGMKMRTQQPKSYGIQ